MPKRLTVPRACSRQYESRDPHALNGILGLTEIMLGEETNEAHRKYLEIIGSSGQNLTLLINDILDFSKIESGKLQLENLTFNFNEVISSNINRYQCGQDNRILLANRYRLMLDDITSLKLKVRFSSCSFPLSILLKSRMSLINNVRFGPNSR